MNIIRYMKSRRLLKQEKTRQKERDRLAEEFKAEQIAVSYQIEHYVSKGEYAEAQRVLNEHKMYVAKLRELAKVV